MNCSKCNSPLSTDNKCSKCSLNMNVTFICSKCGSHCTMYGFCPQCGWIITSSPAPIPIGWKCPGCGRFHAPFISTCPFCYPQTILQDPLWPPFYPWTTYYLTNGSS